MGRVFSWGEIVRKEVPHIKDFGHMCEEIRHELSRIDGVLGAVLFGSALNERFMERSDIDCLLVYDGMERPALTEVLHQLQASARKRHIPLEFIPVDEVSAREGIHTIGPSFAWHLEQAVKTHLVIKADPLRFIRLSDSANSQSARVEDVLGYLRRKILRFDQGIVELPVMAENEYFHFLRKILESPIHVARKVLWLSVPNLSSDSKAHVIRCYPDIVPSPLRGIFQTLLSMDSDYSREVLAELREPHEGRYIVALETIAKRAFWAFEFARANAIFVLNKFS
ncbi:MAG: hypothetical protein UY60_C0011G0018 [Parcubacteria group bacterium GW2011_GWB1_50_9]|uniref:Polymerase nucleotidyl transferase domain-containing protein n=1 Tax=Candidatus Adlerbacteria bacterium GW2011_GWC1_50_9 TaxID=1618608 RepID=A0A0G1WPP9_9BACT|nr:MAG: hypothetical protein UY60_C0011G0018 [Parcubacteria group bacterium GW2011_GWB1_50_9]KKW20319.1 MAG: hypothetical protein UY64_C0052G0005 [Parcubacteria group bacterium GW2011_GWA1_51_12]KKW20818.1 MAG: hypothetical protein UY61_C0022G0015 [Candidatus Adlerbacteria bacterium GW2011_GWC1_50_9]